MVTQGVSLKRLLFMAACFLGLLAVSLIRGEFIVAAVGVIGLIWVIGSYRESKQRSR